VERSSGAAPPRRSAGGGQADGELLGIEFDSFGESVSIVALAGELDLSTIPRLEPRLLGELRSSPAVVVDLTRLSFIDSSGIGLLIKAHRAADGARLLHIVVSPGSQVDRVFSIAGINRALTLFSDRDEAIAAADRAA
jgi:anti-sigma B factor antagonist